MEVLIQICQTVSFLEPVQSMQRLAHLSQALTRIPISHLPCHWLMCLNFADRQPSERWPVPRFRAHRRALGSCSQVSLSEACFQACTP